MEVSRQSDHVTHAVIGAQETVAMGVSNSATLMHVLSTALYTHPMLAAVREILCNGWDGHIVSGRTDTPLQITVDDQFVTIRDFGPGIPHTKIGEIYGTYGNSTKKHDGEQTGGFGLGSKAPFAYTDNFEVTNCHEGQKVIYRVSKSSAMMGGSPSIDTIVKLPTTETGIQVKMNIKHAHDRNDFMRAIEEVCMLGEIKAEMNGRELDRLPLSESPTGYIINSAYGTLLQRINVRYGNVVYPVPKLDAFADIWTSISRVLQGLWSSANVIFMAPPNSITIAPSREALIFSEDTIKTVKGLLASFKPDLVKTSSLTSRQVTNRQVNQIIPTERKVLPGDLTDVLHLKAERGTSQEHCSGPFSYDARKAAVSWAISRRSLAVQDDRLVFKRVKNAIHHGLYGDRSRGEHKVAKIFLKAAQKHIAYRKGRGYRHHGNPRLTAMGILTKELHRYVTAPLMATIKSHSFMDLESIHYVQQKYHWDLKPVNPWKVEFEEYSWLFGFLKPRIVLGRSKKAMQEYLQDQRHKQPGSLMAGWMQYQLPKSDKHYEDIKKVFIDMGYEVHWHCPVIERAARAKKSDDPNYVAPVKKASPKRKGYLTLASAQVGNEFLLSEARSSCPDHMLIKKPIAYTMLDASSDYRKQRLHNIDSVNVCQAICDVFGDQIAVVTSNQIDKLVKEGVPELSKFIYQYVDDKLSAAKDFPRYLAFVQHIAHGMHERPRDAAGVLYGLTQHHDLAASLPVKFRFCVSAETMALSKLYREKEFRLKGTPKCDELSKKIPRSKELDKMLKQVQNSEWTHYVNLDSVGGALNRLEPNAEGTAVPYAIVTHLMTPVEKQQ